MSHKSWLDRLARRACKSPSANTRKRPAFSPIQLEFLEDRTAPATLAWTGATGQNWSTPGNWSPSGVPSATNNVLTFSSATAGLASYTSTNDIPSLTGLTINITDTNTTSDFTIGGANAGIAALSNNKTDGVASATNVTMALTGAGATIAATAGEIAIVNTANVFDAASTLNVPSGGSADITVKPSGSLGNAKINVTGGKVNFTSSPPVETSNVLQESWFTGIASANNGPVDNMGNGANGGLLALTPQGTKFLTVPLNFTPNPSFQDETASPLTGAPLTATDNFGFLWQGSFTAVVAGTYQFGTGYGGVNAGSANLTDDYISVYVDTNDDGVFSASERQANSTYNGSNQGAAITFTAGEKHKIAIGFLEFTGGEFGSASFLIQGDPNFGTQTVIDPSDPLQAGMWSYIAKPANNTGAIPNNVSVSGSSTLTMASFIDGVTLGNLTMASGATLNVVPTGTQKITFGTTSLGGNATFSTGAGATLNLSGVVGETAPSGITKTGAGTLSLGGANTYSGVTNISAGVVNAFNGALGTATGAADGTIVSAGAQLVLKANYASAENLSLNGTGTTGNTNGALTTDGLGNYSFAGPIALQSNAWISDSANALTLNGGITDGANQLTLAGAGAVTVATVGITGTGKVVKTEAGTANLNVASPNLTGDINVAAGTLRVSVDGALGTIAGATNVSSGASLTFVGPASGTLTYATLEPFNIGGTGVGGVGALGSITGNVAVASPLTLTSTTAIGSQTAGAKLTLNGAIALPPVADLSFVGAGNTDVVQGFGNGSTPVSTSKGLFAQYLHNSANRTGTDLTGVGVAPGNQGLLVAGTVWEGNGYLQGPLNVFDNNSPATPATVSGSSGFAGLFGSPSLDITNFSVYYSGVMNVTAAGAYKFATGPIGTLTSLAAPDAQGAFYIDKNQNHVFEDSNTELILNANGNGTSATVNLSPGSYDILIPFTNGGGSGGMNISYSSDNGATYQLIDPSKGTVANTSFTSKTPFTVTPKTNVIESGTGTVTLLGNNTYNGTTTVNSGTLVAGSNTAFGGGAGIVVNSGGSIGLAASGGIAIPASKTISIFGPGANGAGAIVNLGGANTISAPITLARDAAIGSNAGTLTIGGTGINESAWTLTVTGAGNTTINAPITGIATAAPGLVVGQSNTNDVNVYGNLATQPDPTYGSDIDLTPTMGNKSSNDAPLTPTVQKTWATTDTWFYQGQMFWPNSNGDGTGTLSFAENVDDDTYMWVDGVPALHDTSWNTPTSSGPITLPSGWHNVDIRFSNGGGGAGANPVNTWTATYGFGYRVDLDPTPGGVNGAADPAASSIEGSDYAIPTDDGTGNLFRGAVSPTGLAKTGAGTLNLNGADTYKRNTVISGGIVNTGTSNGFGADPAATLTVSGAGTVVNLFDNATAVTTVSKADFSVGSPTVNTGAAGGKLAIGTVLKLGGGYTVAGNMTAQGANVADNTVQRTLSAVTGTLDVSHVDRSTISVLDNGKMFLPGTNLNNTFPYTADANAEMLVVAISDRTDAGGGLKPTVTYDGSPLLEAVSSEGTAGTYINSHIYYLMSPTTGLAANLVVNFGYAINTSTAVYVYTLKGIDMNATPTFGTVANTEGSPISQTVSASAALPGSVALTEFTYRYGTGGNVKEVSNNGTPTYGGASNFNGTVSATSASATPGNFFVRDDGTIVAVGGVFQNLTAGNVSVTATGVGASGSHFTGAVAVFAPVNTPSAINLPATNFALATGAKLSINSPGDDVIGNVTAVGSASIAAGANPPTTLTLGGVGGAGIGTLAINDTLGLKLATGSSFKVDLNGATAGTQYDQTTVAGAVNLNGATLTGTVGFTPAVGSTFTIIANDGTDPVVGTFAGLAQGATAVVGGSTFTISYTGGDGNDVALTTLAVGVGTTTSLVATPLASTGGSPVQFTATVNPSPAALGTVTFLDGGVAIPGGSNIPVVAGVAVFSTSTLAVGTHSVTAAYSGAAGFAPSTSTAQSVVVSAGGTAPSIVGPIATNGGLTAFAGDQHSRVINLQVVFDQAVQLDTDALTLALHTNGIVYNGGALASMGTVPTLAIASSTDKKTWTVTFTGTGVETGADGFASLTDGVYDFKVDATKVHPVGNAGVNMAASSTLTFHRLFGDVNLPAGTAPNLSAVVNTTDNLQFRTAFGNLASYKAYLDSNGDGQINTSDNFQFRTRFSKTLAWTV